MITLNVVARPKILDQLHDGADLTQFRLWTGQCVLEPDLNKLYDLLTELRKVWVTLDGKERMQFARARDIDHAFSWDSTPQGLHYWMDINDRLCALKNNQVEIPF
jgi:hypothetical protein